ncbi:MAG: HAMP domain-containing histidine kinase [Phycisphaeraceae bacterium]|nr:HAMP domain-containing histidine kinase [Phycisphaeraceae bacterium]
MPTRRTSRNWRVLPGAGSRLIVAVVLTMGLMPTVCVLAFMNAAMRNERLAVKQRLTDIYQRQLREDRDAIASLASSWMQLRTEDQTPAVAFERLVRAGLRDSVIVRDAQGRTAYPNQAKSPQNATESAMALQARVREALQSGRKDQAVALLTGEMMDPSLKDAADETGRLIVPNAMLLAMQLMDRGDLRVDAMAEALIERINDYDHENLPASQRLFLMTSMVEMGIAASRFPTLNAERQATAYLSIEQSPAQQGIMMSTATPRLWQMGSVDSRIILLFEEAHLIAAMEQALSRAMALPGSHRRFVPPSRPGMKQTAQTPPPFLSITLGDGFPGWQLALDLDRDPFDAAAKQAEAAYLIAGGSVSIAILLLAATVAAYLRRQIKLTRLKNDLIATVSHELKTPLASMRVLVDTLREGRCTDAKQASEYFELMARENERLTRLIDHFLAFSRMERRKLAFVFEPVSVAEIVETAVSSVRDRFTPPHAKLDVELAPDLPALHADKDAMVTAVLNLLDNAWKYTGEEKQVQVRAVAVSGHVFIEVRDNGVGLSRRAAAKVFDRFYQVDQTLSRRTGGCGLGLSIVKFIIEAHGGKVQVRSQPGQGSTFTIMLPVEHGAEEVHGQ